MGGKQYAIGPARTVNGKWYPSFEKEAEPLLNDYGCLHFKFSILLGVSRPAYSEEQLAQFKAEDNRKFEFEGREYTRYEASQLQKRIESEVRRQKDRVTIAKASGDDIMRREAQYKINLLTNKYAKLSKESGLPTKMERMKSAVKPLTNGNSGGIMKLEGLYRKSSNTGAFAGLPERMSKKHIRTVAKEVEIDLKGITINIDMNEELLRIKYAGRADPENVGNVTFFPNAFRSREELVRTIIHEKQHVLQYKKYGVTTVQKNRMKFEIEAEELEQQFIDKLKKKGLI